MSSGARTRSRRRSFAAVALAGAALLLAGCTPRGERPGAEGGGAPPATSPATTASPPAASAGGETEAQQRLPPDEPTADEPMAGAGPAPSRGGDAPGVFVDKLELVVMESFPVQVRAELRGHLADPCVELGATRVRRDGDTFHVELPAARQQGRMCAQMLVPFRRGVPLDVLGLPRGTYAVEAHGRRASFTLYQDNAPPPRER